MSSSSTEPARAPAADGNGGHAARFAARAGLSRQEIAETLRHPLDAARWSAREATLIAAVDALHDRNGLTAREFDALAAHCRPDQILEILQLVGN